MTRSEALKRAPDKYEKGGRKTLPIGTRLTPDEMRELDEARGGTSRSAFAKAAILERIQHLKHKDTNDG